MAKSFTPTDCHVIMNALYHQATGESDIAVVDSNTFVSAGEKTLATGHENVLNALGIVVGRMVVASRKYVPSLTILNALNTGMYTNRLRKISFYADESLAAGHVNTNLYTNLANGYDNGSNSGSSVASQWEQHFKKVLEMNFAGSDVYQYPITITENQLKLAFRDEAEFSTFIGGYMQECENDLEQIKEQFNRMTLLNKIGSVYDMSSVMSGSAVNLTEAFNAEYGTTYTSAQLRTTYLSEFLKFFVSTFKITSDYMAARSDKYHWCVPVTEDDTTYKILRQTPKSKQRTILYSPLFTKAKASVLPEIFNPEYLATPNGEMVTYWQSIDTPEEIKVIPAVPDFDSTNNGEQKAGTEVDIPYMVGILYDVDGMMTDFQLDDVQSTVKEARKHYYNLWHSVSKNSINDNTENCVIFYMAD